MQDLIAGTIPAVLLVLANALPQAQAGQVRILAITAPLRSPLLPDVPTMREAGFPDMEALEWFGVFAPKGTPATIIEKASQSIRAAADVSDVKARFEQLAFIVEPRDTPSLFADRVARDLEKWKPIVQASGYTAAD